jgi:hypothetical protein
MKHGKIFSIMILWKECFKIIPIWKQKETKSLKNKKKNENEPSKVACSKN